MLSEGTLAVTVSELYILATSYKSTDGILSRRKTVFDIVVEYLAVYHGTSGIRTLRPIDSNLLIFNDAKNARTGRLGGSGYTAGTRPQPTIAC